MEPGLWTNDQHPCSRPRRVPEGSTSWEQRAWEVDGDTVWGEERVGRIQGVQGGKAEKGGTSSTEAGSEGGMI